MFTLEQIKAAHSKVKSGADFPAYVAEIKKTGLQSYEIFVADGHTRYNGAGSFVLNTDAQWNAMNVADVADPEVLKQSLKIHQQGGSDYTTFCRESAEAGVEKWVVDAVGMTCVYYDKAGNNMLEEVIPEV
jgi:uncharacterized protein YbcV (DUF1398 family)